MLCDATITGSKFRETAFARCDLPAQLVGISQSAVTVGVEYELHAAATRRGSDRTCRYGVLYVECKCCTLFNTHFQIELGKIYASCYAHDTCG